MAEERGGLRHGALEVEPARHEDRDVDVCARNLLPGEPMRPGPGYGEDGHTACDLPWSGPSARH